MKNIGQKPTKYKRSRKVLDKIFENYKGICQCCGIKTINMPRYNNEISLDNDATIEHIYSRLTLIRLLLNNNEHTTLFCRKCNLEKSLVDDYEIYGETKLEYKYGHDGLLIFFLNNYATTQ